MGSTHPAVVSRSCCCARTYPLKHAKSHGVQRSVMCTELGSPPQNNRQLGVVWCLWMCTDISPPPPLDKSESEAVLRCQFGGQANI